MAMSFLVQKTPKAGKYHESSAEKGDGEHRVWRILKKLILTKFSCHKK